MEAGGGDRRYLKQLGKKLLQNNQRWSLMSNADNAEMFEDMGVSLLEDNIMSKSFQELRDLIRLHDIENHSPNLQRSLKRSHSKANLSPDSKTMNETETSKSSPSHGINKSTISSIFGNISQSEAMPGSTNSENNSGISPSKILKVSCDRKSNTLKDLSNSNDAFNSNNKMAMGHSSNRNCESNPIDEYVENTSQSSDCQKIDNRDNKLVNSEISIKKVGINHSELVQISPLTTCGPHPPFHKYTNFLSRNTTFDEENNADPKECPPLIKFESDINCDQTVDDIEESDDCVKDSNNKVYFVENYDILSNIINQNKPSSDTNFSTRCLSNVNSPQEVLEKECFVAQNFTYCESCEKKGTSGVTHCTADCRNNDNGFSKLFDEVVLSIFQWLPKKMLVRCMLVCKRWNKLAMNSRLWARVCLGGRVLESGVLPNLMRRHPIVLRLANAQLLSPVIPDVSTQMEWRIQFLDLSAASIAPECLGSILHCCPALQRLSLEGLELSESANLALGKLVNLKVLNLALTTGLGYCGASSLSSIHNLTALNVAWTGLSSEAVNMLCRGLPNTLERLNLSGFRKTLSEKTVEIVVMRCPNIVELDLSDCVMLGEGLMPILQKLKSLEHLALSRCNRLKKSDFLLLNNFNSLQWVDIFGLVAPITPITLSTLHTLLPKIKFNEFIHSAIARPTVGNRRTSIWGLRTRD